MRRIFLTLQTLRQFLNAVFFFQDMDRYKRARLKASMVGGGTAMIWA
ncbi:hypothetical protein [Aristophania vespae]|nr:hypothetical protein [Aristophania vespae]